MSYVRNIARQANGLMQPQTTRDLPTFARAASQAVGQLEDRIGDIQHLEAAIPDLVDSAVASRVGAAISNIWDYPETPHAYDEEFESTTLNPAWTATNWTVGGIDPYSGFAVGTARYELHTNRRRSWLTVQAPADSAGYTLVKNISFSGSFFVWMRANFLSRLGTSPAADDARISLQLSTAPFAANDRIIMFLNETDAGTSAVEFFKVDGGASSSISSGVDQYISAMDAQAIEAVGIQKISTTYHGWAFTSSGTAIWMGSTTIADTIGTVAVQVVNTSTGSPGNAIMGVDFVRFKESAVWLP